jgi:hypothetical protein
MERAICFGLQTFVDGFTTVVTMVVSVNRGDFPPLGAKEWGALVLDEYSLQSIVREMGSNPQRQFCFPPCCMSYNYGH